MHTTLLIIKTNFSIFKLTVEWQFLENAGQVGLGSSRPESSRPGPILSMAGMCLIKMSLFNKSWTKDV